MLVCCGDYKKVAFCALYAVALIIIIATPTLIYYFALMSFEVALITLSAIAFVLTLTVKRLLRDNLKIR